MLTAGTVEASVAPVFPDFGLGRRNVLQTVGAEMRVHLQEEK